MSDLSFGPDAMDAMPCAGPHYIVAWSKYSDMAGPRIVVARSTMRGKPWLRAVRRIGRPGWHVSAWRTKRAATKGMYL